jgi:hypothetical protein
VHGWTLHNLALVLHLLLFAYWLGSDIGVYYASRFVTRPSLSVEARGVALKVMDVVDMAPRICLVLFLPSGVTLMAASEYGHAFAGWPLAAVWVADLAWLALVLANHVRRPAAHAELVHRTDLAVRVLLVVGLLSVAGYAAVVDDPFGATTNPRWLAGKVAAYALTIACGLAIRLRLAPFVPAWAQLVREGTSPEVEARLTASVRGTLPFVYAIWALVVVAAVLGVAKPGSTA